MKILVVSNLYPPFQLGGYEIGCRNVVNGLRARGHDVYVLTSPSHAPINGDISEGEHEEGVMRNLQLRSFQPIASPNEAVRRASDLEAMVTNFTNTSVLLETIRDLTPDCVYLFNLVGIGGLSILDALNSLSYPWVLHLMDRAPVTLQTGFSPTILSLFDAHEGGTYNNGKIISMSKHLVDEVESMCGFEFSNPIEFVPGWARPLNNIVERNYFLQEKVRFVTAGAVQTHKGIDIIVDAAALLTAHGIADFSIEIYGDGNLAYYVDLCKQKGVSSVITFPGSRTQAELMEIYKSSDSFLFPTWSREPFGFAPVEAASVGCVPIITSTCGVAERMVGGVHCLKIDRSAESLFEVMQAICKREIDMCSLGRNGQVIAREDLGFDSCLDQIEGCLNESAGSDLRIIPSWRDINLAFLKHNLAVKLYA